MNLPKTFVITLKDYPNRTNYISGHLTGQNVPFELFEGINGTAFGLKTIIPYKDDDPNGQDYFITSGHIGCILSHLMLWKTLMYLPYDEILILEDDCVLQENFTEKFLKYKSELPNDWQYVFVGHCCLPSQEWITNITDNIISSIHPPMCTHSYMIKKSILPVLIETNSIAWSHIDIQIQKRSLKQLKHYIFNPPLVNQLSITSPYDSQFKSLTYDWEYVKNNI